MIIYESRDDLKRHVIEEGDKRELREVFIKSSTVSRTNGRCLSSESFKFPERMLRVLDDSRSSNARE